MNLLWLLIAIPCIFILGFFFSSMLFSGGRSSYGGSKQEKTANAKVMEIRQISEKQMRGSTSAITGKLSFGVYENVIRTYVTFELEDEGATKVDLLVEEDQARILKKGTEVRITWKKDKCVSCAVREKPLEETEWYIS